MTEIILKPIGIVRSEVKEHKRGGWGEVTSEIVIDEEWTEHLDGIDEFSHIMVVFWMHLVPRENRPPTRIHPRGRADLPLVGLFATRAPYRPNPIGVSVVKLVRRHDNVLTVQGLDAIDGTPVLDIKSYMAPVDKPEDIRMPDWVSKIRTKPRP
ncbi:MAG: tRNA (N6-threonylcarbamoyladenosine(37)-N6)-methyltransferase TrmO [Dehalococcoidia bacterium]|nr:tRNA (N6-threonylcarbamoyladenosine(37)-N6)-methyltransferase TrmO [Dehalococcoidia bacterium]